MVTPFIQFAPETCAWCEGSGKFGQYNTICHMCKGEGSVLVAQPARRCPWCRGSGLDDESEQADRCKNCDGAGWSHVYRPGLSR